MKLMQTEPRKYRKYDAERDDWWATIEGDGVRVYAVDWFGWGF